MTHQQYETFRNEQKRENDNHRPTPCPVHREPMLMMYGAWDYDRLLCGVRGCTEEIELETSSLPKEKK